MEIINKISPSAFDEIDRKMRISFDYTVGESFYRDRPNGIYHELTGKHSARIDNGALCIFHEEHKQFSKQPFIVGTAGDASNCPATDFATALYRTEIWHADELVYVSNGRQHDHFQ
jgi:arginyl-tRNA synthetase